MSTPETPSWGRNVVTGEKSSCQVVGAVSMGSQVVRPVIASYYRWAFGTPRRTVSTAGTLDCEQRRLVKSAPYYDTRSTPYGGRHVVSSWLWVLGHPNESFSHPTLSGALTRASHLLIARGFSVRSNRMFVLERGLHHHLITSQARKGCSSRIRSKEGPVADP